MPTPEKSPSQGMSGKVECILPPKNRLDETVKNQRRLDEASMMVTMMIVIIHIPYINIY